jgi:hypothetical protein
MTASRKRVATTWTTGWSLPLALTLVIRELKRRARHFLVLYAYEEHDGIRGHLFTFTRDFVEALNPPLYFTTIKSQGWDSGDCFVAVLAGLHDPSLMSFSLVTRS